MACRRQLSDSHHWVDFLQALEDSLLLLLLLLHIVEVAAVIVVVVVGSELLQHDLGDCLKRWSLAERRNASVISLLVFGAMKRGPTVSGVPTGSDFLFRSECAGAAVLLAQTWR